MGAAPGAKPEPAEGPRGLAVAGPRGRPREGARRQGPRGSSVCLEQTGCRASEHPGWTVRPPDAPRWSVRSGSRTDSACPTRGPEVVMLGGAVLSACRLPARRRGRGPWRLWGLCRRGSGGGRCHLVGGGGGFRCRPRARPQGVTAKRPSGEGWLLTSGSEQSLSQGQRWPHAGAKGNFSSQVPVPGKCRGLDCLGLSGCCRQSRWAGGERDRRGEMPAGRGSLSLEEHLVFL